MTVLIGANGAGKSQMLAAFDILGRIIDHQDVGRWRPIPAGAEIEVWAQQPGCPPDGFRVRLDPTGERHALAPMGGRQTKPGAGLVQSLNGCRVHHFDDTSLDAPAKRRVDPADNITLADDAHNLAAVLLRLRADAPSRYQRIVRTVRTIAPYFSDFVLDVSGSTMSLQWLEHGLDQPMSAGQLGDGTLRFICLSVLLLQDNPPGTIIIDEPELGLHPFAVHQAAALMKRAAQDRRVVVSTQSTTLLNQFGLDDVAVAERTAAGVQLRRPDATGLEPWLSDTTLGELWEENLLGGRPRPDESPS
ncbi:AAA family ATPase [Kribbella sp. NPDC059898]|uniref:AAA family ATPase n=1 Tax=Kribbella sp. NPDC059898 TaxID=3346995 RepID=UPI00365DEBD2